VYVHKQSSQNRVRGPVSDDDLFELISRSQSRRIDDQRCSLRHMGPFDLKPLQFGDTPAPQNGHLSAPASSSSQLETPRRQTVRNEGQLNEQFFDLLLRSQVEYVAV
jgi:GoLoco motif